MRTIRTTIPSRALILLLLAVLVAACGSAASASPAPFEDDSGQRAGEGVGPGEPEAPASEDGGGSGGDGVGAPVDDAKIIRTGSIQLEVADMAAALATARDGIRALGGYIGASQTWNEGDQPYATVTYRVPVERWEDALALLRSLNGQTSKVVAEQTQSVEVTGQVVDLEARIRNLEASEAALQAIAEQAVRISDVLEVQSQLTQVRGEIESLEAQLKDLSERAAYATLTAQFDVPVVAVTAAKGDWDPAKTIDEAVASLIGVGQGLATAGIWFVIVWLPMLLTLGLIVVISVGVARRLGWTGRRRPTGGGEVAAS